MDFWSSSYLQLIYEETFYFNKPSIDRLQCRILICISYIHFLSYILYISEILVLYCVQISFDPTRLWLQSRLKMLLKKFNAMDLNTSDATLNWWANRKSVSTDSRATKWKNIITDSVASPNAQTIDAKYYCSSWKLIEIMTQVTSAHTVDEKYHNWQFGIRRWRKTASVIMQSIITDYHILLPVHFSNSLNCLISYTFSLTWTGFWYFVLWDFHFLNCAISYDTFPLTWTGLWYFVGYDTLPIGRLIYPVIDTLLWRFRWSCWGKNLFRTS